MRWYIKVRKVWLWRKSNVSLTINYVKLTISHYIRKIWCQIKRIQVVGYVVELLKAGWESFGNFLMVVINMIVAKMNYVRSSVYVNYVVFKWLRMMIQEIVKWYKKIKNNHNNKNKNWLNQICRIEFIRWVSPPHQYLKYT